MKKNFSLFLLTFLSFSLTFAQSGGGTSFDRKLEQLSERAERLAEKVEVQAETTAENWEQRAEDIAQRFEMKWENNWSQNRLWRKNKATFIACPEVSFLGIEAMHISIEKAKKLGFDNRYGSYVSKVMAKSVAEAAGLQAFDYIYGVDEQRTSDNQSLSEILEDFEPGDEVELHYMRKGQKLTSKVKLADDSDYDYEEENQKAFLGVSPSDEEYDEEDFDGVSVEIVEKSTAAEMGLQVGDVITSINGFPVLDWDDVTTAIRNTKPGQSIEVNFKRDDKELSAKGTIKAYEDQYPEGDETGNWNLDIDWGATGNVVIEGGDDWGLDQDEQDENRAFLGIYTEMISKEKARKLSFDNPYGTYITGIIPTSGAEKAGLKPFDYIYGFDEYRAGEQQSLGLILKKYKPGEKTTVHFIRKGKKSTTTLVFTKPFKADKQEMDSCEDAFFGIIQVSARNDEGVAISPVKGSTAAELALKEGDVLTHINGYQVVDWQDVTTAISMIKPGETITVDYLRHGKPLNASKPIKSYAQTKNCPNCDCDDNESVVIAKTPGSSTWPGWEVKSFSGTSPRVNVQDAKIELGNISQDEISGLRNKGIQLSSNNSLTVESLKISPNSTTGMFQLEFNMPTSGNTLVRIYNLAGRTLYEYDLGKFSGKFSDSVDISQNGTGNYFLEITQGGKGFNKKIELSKG
ncbi:MAG: PDZ domain-containing protein [Saprospiraceae bacterium]|jgi:S1-C subfamily serine protease|nr:PDZ domain-containing protein [Saprospiraceae bacterium]